MILAARLEPKRCEMNTAVTTPRLPCADLITQKSHIFETVLPYDVRIDSRLEFNGNRRVFSRLLTD